MRFHPPPLRASPPFTPFHPFVNQVGVKVCACIKSSMLGKPSSPAVDPESFSLPCDYLLSTAPTGHASIQFPQCRQ